jgi:hypothetical protein
VWLGAKHEFPRFLTLFRPTLQKCVARHARRVLRINRQIARRRAKCHRKPERRTSAPSTNWIKTDTIHHVITQSVWRHAIDCENMRNGK